jgi:electron-transferring-flavoprotein dehydrogenase
MSQRESMDFDVVIVGAGPAGLAAAIRLKQQSPDCNVVVVEKGSEVGAHILSGAVIDPIGLDALLPDWRKDSTHPLRTPVTDDQFHLLGPAGSLRIPNFLMPKILHNHGNYIASLGEVTRWLGTQAESLGVEIYPGFAAAEVIYDENDAVVGIATGDMGIGKDGQHTSNYTQGMELRGKYVLFAEGARGSLSKQVIAKYKLDADCEPAKFGIGLKELWQVKPENHKKGLVQHTFGWPLSSDTGGGSFLYHLEDNLVAIGFVVHLNYSNPTLSPFDEFQRYKQHPNIRPTLEGGKRLSYGARAITEGGYQSVPKLVFKGGALLGCAAGFVNVPRIKGSHNAILSGIQAANEVVLALNAGRAQDELTGYEEGWHASPIGQDLKPVRNVKPLWSKLGLFAGVALGGLDMWTNTLFGFSFFGTMKHGKPDHATLKPLSEVKPITYPKPDGIISFDKLSSVFLSSTNHEENQPAHLKLQDASLPITHNLPHYGEPARLYCPAGVYEVIDNKFVINAQNCVHCKTCDIKDPSQNITWCVPEGAGGPNYATM